MPQPPRTALPAVPAGGQAGAAPRRRVSWQARQARVRCAVPPPSQYRHQPQTQKYENAPCGAHTAAIYIYIYIYIYIFISAMRPAHRRPKQHNTTTQIDSHSFRELENPQKAATRIDSHYFRELENTNKTTTQIDSHYFRELENPKKKTTKNKKNNLLKIKKPKKKQHNRTQFFCVRSISKKTYTTNRLTLFSCARESKKTTTKIDSYYFRELANFQKSQSPKCYY
jgi:hypothetical protein